MEGAQTTGAIWKETRPITDVIVLELPEGSTLLDVGDQAGEGALLDFWFFVPDVLAALSIPPAMEERTIRVFGTGIAIDPLDVRAHWKTVVTAGGALVWHVFKEGKG